MTLLITQTLHIDKIDRTPRKPGAFSKELIRMVVGNDTCRIILQPLYPIIRKQYVTKQYLLCPCSHLRMRPLLIN